MKQRKVKWIARLLVFALVLESSLLSSVDMVLAKTESSISKLDAGKADALEEITDPCIEKDTNMQSGQKKSTEKEWEFVVDSKLPLDKLCFYSDNNPEGKGYYYGYKDGKVAVLDENLECHTNADFDGIVNSSETEWHNNDWEDDIIVKGKPAVIAYKDVIVEDESEWRYGIMSCTGETLVQPKYENIERAVFSYLPTTLLSVETENGKKGIWDSELEELVPCQYGDIEIDYDDDRTDEQQLFRAYNKGVMDVYFDKKKIYQEKYDEKKVERVSAHFDEYENKECIRISVEMKYDENDGKTSPERVYWRYIAYDGTPLTNYETEKEWEEKEDKRREEEYEKELEESKKWLAEQGEKDEEEVIEFFRKKGVTLSNVSTVEEIQFPGSSSQPYRYYWITVTAEYCSSGDENESTAISGKLTYELIYNQAKERLIAGRSFGQSKVWDDYFPGYLCNKYACLTLLSNDGELCYLDQYLQEVILLCKIEEDDALTYLYVRDAASSDHDTISKNGKSGDGDSHTEPHQLYFEGPDDNILGRYVETKLVDGSFQKKRHDYWIDYYGGKAYSGENIIAVYGNGAYYFTENADAGIDIYRYGIADEDFVVHLDCSPDEIKDNKIIIQELNHRYIVGLCVYCNQHKKAVFCADSEYFQSTYKQLGISDNISDTASVENLSEYSFAGHKFYFSRIDDIGLCMYKVGKISVLSRVDKATVECIKGIKDRGSKIVSETEETIETDMETSNKIYLFRKWKKEKSANVIMIDKNTYEITRKEIPYYGKNVESYHVLDGEIFIQYYQKEDDIIRYGLLDAQGNDQGLLGTKPIQFVGNYMIQDKVLYDSSFQCMATEVYVVDVEVEDDEGTMLKNYSLIGNAHESSGFKPMLVDEVTGKKICHLPDNIFICDDEDEDGVYGERGYSYKFLNGFLGLCFRVNGKQRTLMLDASGKVVFYGEAYIQQNKKEHKITVYGENKGVLGQEDLTDTHKKAVGVNVTYHTQQEIRDYAKKTNVSLKDALSFSENPVTNTPYALGKLSNETLKSAVNMLNQVRYIAGISDNVQLSDSYNQLAQAAALVNYANDQLSHNPTQPEGMSDAMYDMAKEGASSSNIAWASWPGCSLNSTIISSWMEDGDDSNIARVGHRRWLLNPVMGETGFGAVSGENGTYSAVYAFDRSNNTAQEYGVMWPTQNMPVEYFGKDYPWSVSMGYAVDESKVQVTLTRKKDGKKWSFSKASSDGDFYVNNDGYGQKGCIIFRPDQGIDEYNAGEEFEVEITGLEKEDVFYSVDFFKLDTDSTPAATPTVKPDATPTVKPSINPTERPIFIFTMSPNATVTPTATPGSDSTSSPTPAVTPDPAIEPTETPLATVTPSVIPSPVVSPDVDSNDSTRKLKKGSKVTDEKTKAVYRVTGMGNKKAVEYIKNTKNDKVNVTVPDTIKLQGKSFKVTSIAKKAFKNSKKLKTVSMGKNVKKIGSQAFSGCKKLKKVTIGKNVTAIEANAFSGCNTLTLITIPAKVKKIGEKAFYQCKNLRYIMLKTNKLTLNNVGKNAFGGGYYSPRVKTDKNIWKKYSRILLKRGISGKTLFIINPVKLVI